MILREIASWPIAFKDVGICDRYARKVNEMIRDKSMECMCGINYEPPASWSDGKARMDWRDAKRAALRLRRQYEGSGLIIRKPVEVIGEDTIRGCTPPSV